MRAPSLSLVLAAIVGVAARGAVTFGPLFADHAVLQEDLPLPVWGHAAAGERVTVAFAGQRVAAVAGGDGRWEALLGPVKASAAGTDLVASGASGTATAHDVV